MFFEKTFMLHRIQGMMVPAFTVVGITVRTTNAEEFAGSNRIAHLWERFFAENVLAQIVFKIDSNIINCYGQYESDKNGAYTVLLGVRVSEARAVPEGMTVWQVPEQKMCRFTTNKGKFPDVIVDQWQAIWTLENQGSLVRSYGIDFAVHDERAKDPQNAQVDIYIGVKNNNYPSNM